MTETRDQKRIDQPSLNKRRTEKSQGAKKPRGQKAKGYARCPDIPPSNRL